ncbi:MAG: hypothetical protein AAFQ82_09165, partial [Myxococcota bacterium]
MNFRYALGAALLLSACEGQVSVSEDEIPTPSAQCGDGNVDPGEGCDDGNLIDLDGCSSACVVEASDPVDPVCGNGEVE